MTAARSGRHASVHELRVVELVFVRLLLLHVLSELLLGLVVLSLGLLHGLLELLLIPLLLLQLGLIVVVIGREAAAGLTHRATPQGFSAARADRLAPRPVNGEATRRGGCGDPARFPRSR